MYMHITIHCVYLLGNYPHYISLQIFKMHFLNSKNCIVAYMGFIHSRDLEEKPILGEKKENQCQVKFLSQIHKKCW